MPDAINEWNYPLKAHTDYAKEAAATAEFAKKFNIPIDSPVVDSIRYSTQQLNTTPEVDNLSKLFGTSIKKEGAVVDEPPFYSSQLQGSFISPFYSLFGSISNLSHLSQVVREFVDQSDLPATKESGQKIITMIDGGIIPIQELYSRVKSMIGSILKG